MWLLLQLLWLKQDEAGIGGFNVATHQKPGYLRKLWSERVRPVPKIDERENGALLGSSPGETIADS